MDFWVKVGFATSCWGLQGNTNPQKCFVWVFQLTEIVESETRGAREEEETMVSLHLSWFVLYQNLRLKIISLWSLFLFFFFFFNSFEISKYLSMQKAKKNQIKWKQSLRSFAAYCTKGRGVWQTLIIPLWRTPALETRSNTLWNGDFNSYISGAGLCS